MLCCCKFHAILILWITINSFPTCFSFSANETDLLALLAFKAKINSDPLGKLNLWNDSVHYCDWYGITCSRRHHDRVTVLDFESQQLEGTLSPHIGNLSFLKELWLGTNNFHGPIPQSIGHLSRLRVLSLANNSFSDQIPTNLTHCSELRQINFLFNELSGGIPIELTSLSKLNTLILTKNELKGSIPSSVGNLSSLTKLSLAYTSLTGNLPDDLCRMTSLEIFQVSSNNFTGTLPSCLFNLSKITLFSVSENRLKGSLPQDIGLSLPNLRTFTVGLNELSGLIPLSFSNASRLELLELGPNQLTGQVPRDLGKLPALNYPSFYSNRLGSSSGDDLNFITSLTNCSNLQRLQVGENHLKGSIPNSIANLSIQIRHFRLEMNQIYGSIPTGITDLTSLYGLDLSQNYLTGEIPNIESFPEIRFFYLYSNELSGQIPNSFYNSTMLSGLVLGDNKLHGKIPPSLGNCRNLAELSFADNRLSGTIPRELIGLSNIHDILDLSNNALTGSLPSEVGNLSNLETLVLSGNKLSGHIPSTLGDCLTLQYLSIAGNMFTGSIPQSLIALRGIKELNFSHNKLSGEIPKIFANFTSLISVDLSYNELEGSVPTDQVFANASAISVGGNSRLCGGVNELKLPPCHTSKRGSLLIKVVLPVTLVSVCLVVLSCFLFVCCKRRKSNAIPHSLSSFSHQFTRISYAELLKATNGFSIDNLIGVGSYGSVYKGVLHQVSTTIAVKVINLQREGASKSFFSECNALRNIRHRNLLKIITTCSSVTFQGHDFKALVFEYMPNGSLEDWLHSRRNEQHDELMMNLNFLQRLNIAIDVAYALDYLHNRCQPPIVHCDLKPSNVLLDNDLTAHVADFGLAKIFSTAYDSSQSQSKSLIKGSIGYVAPEYGTGGEVSMKGDVYSYGILLLEMLTGKRPTNEMFQDGQTLHGVARSALPEQVMNIMDPSMLLKSTDEAINGISNQSNQRERVRECLVSAVRLGVVCSAESPMERMLMGDVITELYHIRDHYQGGGIHLES